MKTDTATLDIATLACQVCGGGWFACSPGTVAEDQEQGNLFKLKPAAEVPMQVWCLDCWPLKK